MSTWLALGLVLAAGVGMVRVWLGRPGGPGALGFELGAGFLVGFLGLGAFLCLFGAAPLAFHRDVGAAALFLVAMAAWAWNLRRSLTLASRAGIRLRPASATTLGVCAVLLLLAALLALQVHVLPTLAWDGWNAWLAKVRIWSEAGATTPLLTIGEWLQQPPDAGHAVAGAPYPEALPRAVLWWLSWRGGWDEGAAHLPWMLLWLALGGIFFGGLVRAGLAARFAVLATLLLLSLPLLTAHVAMSGYADLWLAAVILLASFTLLELRRSGRRGSLVLWLLCLLLLPMVKMEGAVYALLFLAAAVLWWLPTRWRLATAALLLLGPVALWLGLQVSIPVPGLGWIGLKWGEVSVPVIGTLPLYWRPVGEAVVDALFVLPSFSLIWYLAIAVPILCWRRLAQPGLSPLAGFLAGAVAFHFVLFFLTDASAWAENLTSLNRLLLHVVPAWAALISLLLGLPDQPSARRYGRFASPTR